jgi:uroporphyrinogen decarboxylase
MVKRDLFLQACQRQAVSTIPVWYMRQAGRYQPEYRKVREKYSLLDICKNPKVCYEVTKLPVEQLGVDAAILFSDIMVPLGPMGVRYEIRENVGPMIEHPLRTMDDVSRLELFDVAKRLPYVLESIDMLANDLDVPLIGFTGAPFTLASYLIEGGPSKNYLHTKRLMVSDRAFWNTLMDKLSDMIVMYLKAQVEAGASAIQIFDSWVGSLSVGDFREYVLPTMQKIFAGIRELGVPMIYFGVGTGELLESFAETGASVIGVDWRVPLSAARKRVGDGFALQGNLDPALLFAPWSEIERRVRQILEEGAAAPGYVFNLGHGVLPGVEVSTLQRLTQFVHAYSQELLSAR